jgi:hypothetical protein
MSTPEQALATALDAVERDLDTERDRWPAVIALLAAVCVGVSFLLPWRIGDPGTTTLSYPGYGDHRALLVWWGLGLAVVVARLRLGGRARLAAAVLGSAIAAVLWYLSVRAAGADVVTEGGALFWRAELSAGPGPALAVVATGVMLAAGLVPIVRRLLSKESVEEFSEYQLRDAVRRLRSTRTDRPVDTPRLTGD